jgi:hypothetical protein
MEKFNENDYLLLINYPLIQKNSELQAEFTLFNSISYCFLYNQKDFELSLKDFEQKSKFKNSTEFIALRKAYDSNQDTQEIFLTINEISQRLIKEDDKISKENFLLELDELLEESEDDFMFKTSNDDWTDDEEQIMNSFKNGTQDNFGF